MAQNFGETALVVVVSVGLGVVHTTDIDYDIERVD